MMKFIDLSVQQEAIKEQLDARLATVLAHGQYIMGPEVKELECVLKEYVGVRHCVTVSSGTDALLISLMALGVGPGDEVITTPFSFISTVEVIALLGATPVFVDVEEDTGLIDASLIEEKITKKTKAILPVSLYGQMPDMKQINAIACEYGNIAVIEDGAQSFGATFLGEASCGMTTVGCTSFFPSKPLGCYGDGGAIFTNENEIASEAAALRIHGQTNRYVHDYVGVGGRMDTLQCAIVLAKWSRFNIEKKNRQSLGKRYRELFLSAGLPRKNLFSNRAGRESIFGQFTIKVSCRDQVRAHLSQEGVPTAVHYPKPINEQPAYKKQCMPGQTPIASLLSKQVLSLPFGPDLIESDQEYIVKETIRAISKFDSNKLMAA